MISPQEADLLAKKLVADYVTACSCATTEDAGNVLMKLVSVAGIFMCATVGQEEAVARLEGTAAHVAKPEFSGSWTMEKLQ